MVFQQHRGESLRSTARCWRQQFLIRPNINIGMRLYGRWYMATARGKIPEVSLEGVFWTAVRGNHSTENSLEWAPEIALYDSADPSPQAFFIFLTRKHLYLSSPYKVANWMPSTTISHIANERTQCPNALPVDDNVNHQSTLFPSADTPQPHQPNHPWTGAVVVLDSW